MAIIREQINYEEDQGFYYTDSITYEEGEGTLTCEKIVWTEDAGLIDTWVYQKRAKHLRPITVLIKGRL